MKKIEPVQIWTNGITKTAEFLEAHGINLLLGIKGEFVWNLFTKDTDAEGNEIASELIASGNLEMVGDECQQWNDDEFAWEWVANQLNLVILS